MIKNAFYRVPPSQMSATLFKRPDCWHFVKIEPLKSVINYVVTEKSVYKNTAEDYKRRKHENNKHCFVLYNIISVFITIKQISMKTMA